MALSNQIQQESQPFPRKWIIALALIMFVGGGIVTPLWMMATKDSVPISSVEFPSLQRAKTSQAKNITALSPPPEYEGVMPISIPLNPEYVYRYDTLKDLDPEKIVHPGQFIATFILLANHGRIDKAMAMVAPEAQSQLQELAETIDQEQKTSGLKIQEKRDAIRKARWKSALDDSRYGTLKFTSDIIDLEPAPKHNYLLSGNLYVKPRVAWEDGTLPKWQIVNYDE